MTATDLAEYLLSLPDAANVRVVVPDSYGDPRELRLSGLELQPGKPGLHENILGEDGKFLPNDTSLVYLGENVPTDEESRIARRAAGWKGY